MEAVRLTGVDLARLRVDGPAALEGAMRDPFRLFLAGEGFAAATQTTYAKRARGFLKWLIHADSHPDALTDSAARDDAVLEYLSTTSVPTRKVTLAAVRALYDWLGLGPVCVDPVAVERVRPPTLSVDEQSRVLDAAAARSARDYALMVSWLDVGPRPSEVRRLDIGDAELSARGGRLRLTRTDGQQRWVELTQASTWVLLGWRTARATLLGARRAKSGPLFISLTRHGRIQADQSLEYIVGEIGRDAGIDTLTPWTLRATVKTRLYADGLSASEVAARMGQSYTDSPQVRALYTHAGSPAPVLRRAATSGQLSFDLEV
ncbi:tyrosine-type recombinase/integrase [Nocardia yamanashiensis]|uniref:tyrosine-type recombinase/integrase n=1 Tax=Nocardia yamanashiensis TaxID=209247 RepID=UPI000A41DC75|nr:site-specific integrase [Nocardia yamanashiensis]